MRLLKASDIRLVEFSPDNVPPYAILSHTWGADEVLFADIENGTAEDRAAYHKVKFSCQQAVKDGCKYVWIDTCCIDKKSSAEVSEAINTMYQWYQQAKVCYAYLEDVLDTIDCTGNELARSRWFTRGWTLQELLAPSHLLFYTSNWELLGEKKEMCSVLQRITGIQEDILTGTKPVESASIAQRMSWAARRRTTKLEDVAYSLLGLFSVNMPLLYGEGPKAFLRLQEEIMKRSYDQSIFAWIDPDADRDSCHGLLAKSPAQFRRSNKIVPYQDRGYRAPYTMSNRGLCIELHLTRLKGDIYAAAIDCPGPLDIERSGTFLGIHLKRISDGNNRQYVRVNVGKFCQVKTRGRLQTVYVQQSGTIPSPKGVYPHQRFDFKLAPLLHNEMYSVVDIIVPAKHRTIRKNTPTKFNILRHFKFPTGDTRAYRNWINEGYLFIPSISVPKSPNRFAVGVVLERSIDRKQVVVCLGSGPAFSIGFDVLDMEEHYSRDALVDWLQESYDSHSVGRILSTRYHRVRVNAEETIQSANKIYVIDITVKAIPGSFRVASPDLSLQSSNKTLERSSSSLSERKLTKKISQLWRSATV